MDRLEIRSTIQSDIDYLSAHMRKSDIIEVDAFNGQTPREALEMSVGLSDTFTAIYDGYPALIFGVSGGNGLTGTGIPWMLVSDKMEIPPRIILNASKRIVANMQHMYYYLENYVDARNMAAIKWLKWLGFEFAPALPIGRNGELFYRFFWKRSDDKMSSKWGS